MPKSWFIWYMYVPKLNKALNYFHRQIAARIPVGSVFGERRREALSRREGERKGNSQKVKETKGHSNWTICSLFKWFCSKIIPPSWPIYWGLPFLITPERGRKEAAGAENGEKGITQKWMRHRGFRPWGHSNWTICSLLKWFCSKIIPPS